MSEMVAMPVSPNSSRNATNCRLTCVNLVESPYLALRVVPTPSSAAWWSAARRTRPIPESVATLMNGRTRVELSAAEADEALAWADAVDGWADAEPKPLHVHRTS
jgi:hypothetical protein